MVRLYNVTTVPHINYMEKSLLRVLRNWGMKDRRNFTRLAFHLGYSSPDTIRQWIYRKSIPNHQIKRVGEFINESSR